MIGALTATIFDEARRIWCYRWLALAVSVAVLGAGVSYVLRMHHVYDAWTQVFVSKQTPLTTATEGVSLVGDSYGSAYVVQKTLLNDDSLEAVVKLRTPGAAKLDKADLAQAAAKLRNHIHVVTDQGDGFIEFHYSDTDPVRARDTVALLLQQFISRNVDRSRTDLDRAEKFLDQQISAYAGMLLESQSNIALFRSRHPEAVFTPAILQAGELDAPGAAMPAGQPTSAAPQPLVSSGPIRSSAPAPSAPSIPRSTPAADKLAALQAKLATLLTTYTDQYPDVVSTRRQLAEAMADRDREAAAIAALAATAPPGSQAEAGARPAASGRVIGRSARAAAPILAPAVAAQWVDLQHRDQVLRLGYQQLIGKREATRMSEAIYDTNDAGKYQVTRPPTIPTQPSGPNRRMFLGIAALLSIACGLGAAYVRAGMKGILVTPNELENVFQLPVVGTVSLEGAWYLRRHSDRHETRRLASPSSTT